MTRDEIIKTARELDMIDFRDDDSDAHVAQFIDFLVTLVGKAEAAAREECAALCDRFQARDVGMQPAECAAAIRAMNGKGTA